MQNSNLQNFDPTIFLIAVVISYLIRLTYLRYLKPKLENRKPNVRFDLNSVIINAIDIGRFLAYALALAMGMTAMKIAMNYPDDATVEIPAKFILLITSMTLMLTLFVLSSLWLRKSTP